MCDMYLPSQISLPTGLEKGGEMVQSKGETCNVKHGSMGKGTEKSEIKGLRVSRAEGRGKAEAPLKSQSLCRASKSEQSFICSFVQQIITEP